jgi:hypothetical protein
MLALQNTKDAVPWNLGRWVNFSLCDIIVVCVVTISGFVSHRRYRGKENNRLNYNE